MKLHEHPQTLRDVVLGFIGTSISAMSTIVEFVPYIFGLGLSAYAIYNQHMLAKINRKKLQKLEQEEHEGN